jgi:hypothetical protein
MIIYGTRSSHVKSVMLEKEACPHCGTQGSVLLSTYAKYAHVFWIPLFPIGRLSVSQCQHCKQTLEHKQMPAQIRAYHERNLTESRVPLWQFAGLGLIFVLVSLGVYNSNADKKEQAEFLKSPKSGDIYEYKSGPAAYTTFKITEVVNTDTLAVNFNAYETNKITGLTDIDKEENYSDTTYFMTRAKLMEMYASGDILDINRK